MKIEINEQTCKTLLEDNELFSFLLYGYENYDVKKEYFSSAIQQLKKKPRNVFLTEKELKTDLNEFVDYIGRIDDRHNYKKQILYVMIKEVIPGFEEAYIAELKKESQINSNTTKFVLEAIENKQLKLNSNELIIKLLKVIANEKMKIYSSCYIKEMDKLFKNEENVDLYREDFKEIIENYKKNQRSLNKKDFSFLNRNKKICYKIYKDSELPKFLHDLYNNRSELDSKILNKTKKDIYLEIPTYFKKDDGINISLKKELKSGELTRKKLLEDPIAYPTLLIRFDYTRFAANNSSDSIYLGQIFYQFAHAVKNIAKKEDFGINDFVSTEEKGTVKFVLGFKKEEDAVHLKNVLDSFITELVKHSINKKSKTISVDITNQVELEKYLTYYILANDVKKDTEIITIRSNRKNKI